jgi:hypothetical protein
MYESYGRGVEHNGSLSNRRAGCTREPSLTIILCTGDLSPTFNQLRKIQRRWIRPAVMDLRTYTSNYNPTHACNNPTRRQQTGTCHRPRRPRGAIYSCKLSDTYVRSRHLQFHYPISRCGPVPGCAAHASGMYARTKKQHATKAACCARGHIKCGVNGIISKTPTVSNNTT